MEDLVTALSSLRGERVLITGDTGFKGSWLALWLSQAGAQVFGAALPPEHGEAHFHALGLAGRIRHRDADIRDPAQLAAVFAEARPAYVFHLAAQPLVRRSYRDPKETFDTNVGGAVNLLECVRQSSAVKSLVFITSDKCYRNREWLWGYRENDELGGHDPYSASKAAAELVFAAYAASYFRGRTGLGCASARAGNVIGGGDWSENRIVPDCIRALRRGEPILLRRPQATRPWQHVLEPLSGYIQLAAALARDPVRYDGAWNFGPGGEMARTVLDLANGIAAQWGGGRVEVRTSPDDPHEAGLLHLNCDKAHQLLGWRTRWDFARTVAETANWYREVRAGAPAEQTSREQIQRYLES
jgi:CDP-glucose 4,6-dehydratase